MLLIYAVVLIIGKTEIAGLISPNGTGKTTVFSLLTNVYKPTRGSILLDGMDTAGKHTYQVNKLGIAIMLIEHDMNLVMGICEGIWWSSSSSRSRN